MVKNNPPKDGIAIGWLIFWILVLLPGVLSLLMFYQDGVGGDALLTLFVITWLLCSLYCGIWSGNRLGSKVWMKVLLAFLISLGVAAVNFVLFFIGCVANFNIH